MAELLAVAAGVADATGEQAITAPRAVTPGLFPGLFAEQFGGLDGLRQHRDQFVCLFGRHPETGLR